VVFGAANPVAEQFNLITREDVEQARSLIAAGGR